jgi:ribosomal protein L11 methyltransferase
MASGPGEIRILPWRDEGQAEKWKDFFKPLLLGKRLVIKPTWEDYLPRPSEVIVAVDPGRAFGTGRHPTTTLCLRFLERQVKGGERVLDVGTGSGILAIAAAKLGAGRVTALEIDPESAQVAWGNVKLNGVEEKVEVVEGTLCSLFPAVFEILVANLTVEEILPLVPALSSRLASPDGILFLSGILRGERNHLLECLEARQLSVKELEVQGEWVGVGVTNRAGHGNAPLLRT